MTASLFSVFTKTGTFFCFVALTRRAMGTLHILPPRTYDDIIRKRSAKLDSVFGVDWIFISATEGALRGREQRIYEATRYKA